MRGQVKRTNTHYVHERSTSVELELLAYDASQLTDADYAAVDALQTALDQQCETWNRAITKQLYAELEYQQSDACIIESLDANEVLFDADGNQVDAADFMPFAALEPKEQARVLARQVRLTGLPAEQMLARLQASEERFDSRGNVVDLGDYKPVQELPEPVKTRVLDKHRGWNVADDFWAEYTIDEWKERLESYGFEDVDIAYSLGYGQGDGASFTAKALDVKKLCERRDLFADVQESAQGLTARLLEGYDFTALLAMADAEKRRNTWEVTDADTQRVFYVPDTGDPHDVNRHLVDGHRYTFRKVARPLGQRSRVAA